MKKNSHKVLWWLLWSAVGVVAILILSGKTVQIQLRNSESMAKEQAVKESAGAADQPMSSPAALTNEQTQALNVLNEAFAGLAAQLSPSVVNIYTTVKLKQKSDKSDKDRDPRREFFEFFFGGPMGPGFPQFPQMPQEQQALGSGFILDAKEGYIVTNSHVARPESRADTEIMIKFIGQSKGKGFEAKVVGVDPSTDVALLKLKAPKTGLSEVKLGESKNLRVGEWVLAIGNPYGHTHSVTQGIISALGRDLEDLSRADFIQTSASINPGNSGGPLFNLKGEVIGINTAIDARAQGIGFAIPIDVARSVVKQLKEHGEVERGWLGIAIADLNPQLSRHLGLKIEEGVLVQGIEKGTPAAKSGLKVYDVIVAVNDQPVASAKELSNKIAEVRPRTKISLKLYREKKLITVTVAVGKRPSEDKLRGEEPETEKEPTDMDKPFVEATGLILGPLDAETRSELQLPESVGGALVEKVVPYGLAQQSGIRPGDVLIEINRKNVKSAEAAIKEIKVAIQEKSAAMIRVQRSGGWSAVVIMDFANTAE